MISNKNCNRLFNLKNYLVRVSVLRETRAFESVDLPLQVDCVRVDNSKHSDEFFMADHKGR